MNRPLVSVILATYNQPNALRLAVAGLRSQAFQDFEVVVADDGSADETRGLIERLRGVCPFPIDHVWQANRGFRKARISNEAVLHSRGAVLVFCDGDCVPARDFVGLHASYCPPDGFSVGGYVYLLSEETSRMTEDAVFRGEHERLLSRARLWLDRLEHARNLLARVIRDDGRPRMRGCNFAVSRRTFFGVNGYDENFDGFGKEDSDLRNRLVRSGARAVSLWGRSRVFHLDPGIDAEYLSTRIPRRKDLARAYYYDRRGVPARCENGLFKNGEDHARSGDAPDRLRVLPEGRVCPRCGGALPAGT